MSKLKIELARCPRTLQPGLAVVMKEYADRFTTGPGAQAVEFHQDVSQQDGGLQVSAEQDVVTVRYGRRIDAFRAIGRIMGLCCVRGRIERGFQETPLFETMCVFIDVSRNGVLQPDAAKSLLLRCALMGINTGMLYAEDTFQVPDEPFFGYLRGGYTHNELVAIDDFAHDLGMEMIPCIQAMGHMEQILRWPAYAEYRDTEKVILVGESKTYAFLDKLIAAASAPFRSRRIFLGMDEVHGLGTGRYKELHGERRQFDIFSEHLQRVRQLCQARSLKPMIFSDMYFRFGSKRNYYYDKECVIPQDVLDAFPRDVQLVYWDYYHTEKDFYADWIDRHRAFGTDPIVAASVWTSNRLWANAPFSFKTAEPCLRACKEKGIQEVITCYWGDDGMECDVFSALPCLQYFAEHGYAQEVDQEDLRLNFRGSCDSDFDAWVNAAALDNVRDLPGGEGAFMPANTSKWLLWQDPVLSLMDHLVEDLPLRDRYQRLSEYLATAATQTRSSERLLFPAAIARVLALKVDLRCNIAKAYAGRDLARLKDIVAGDLAKLRTAVDDLWRLHRRLWLATHKPFGFEVIEVRYGGLRARLESLQYRLESFISGEVSALPELEVEFQSGFTDPYPVYYHQVKTPSFIK